jgi:hypothetical protein
MDLHPANAPVVHSYDLERRAVRCGALGYPASTKYARGVTCPECLRLLEAAERDARSGGDHQPG